MTGEIPMEIPMEPSLAVILGRHRIDLLPTVYT